MPDFLQPSNVVPAPDTGPNPALMAQIGALMRGQPPARATTNPYEDDKALLALFKDYDDRSFASRWMYERTWWRNLLYVLGRQWIFYNQTRGAWQDKRMQKWVPRPVTNKVAETVDALRAVFQSVDLGITARPMSDDPVDTETAQTSDALQPSLHEEHDMGFRLSQSDFWAITTGNAFWHPYFDTRAEHGQLLIPFEKCVACQAVVPPQAVVDAGQRCPSCGSPSLEQARDGAGNLVGHELPRGRGATVVCSPFEIGFPSGVAEFDDLGGLVRKRWRTKEHYERYFPELAKTLTFEKMAGERSLQLLKSLASQTDISGTALGAQLSETAQSEGLVESELWLKPTKTYPGGLLLRVVGAQPQVLRSDDERVPGPLPLVTAKGQPIFPWIHVGYQRFGGRILARAPLDLGIQKQDQINQLDSLMLLGVLRSSNPVWLEPKGAEVKRFTGEPGLVVRYNPFVAGGNAKPERVEGANVPSAAMLRLRQQYVQDFESAMGTQDVLKGTKPGGVSAFSAMQFLAERAQSRFNPFLAERGRAYGTWFQMALEIERAWGPDDRVVAAMGANRRWTFASFKNADIQGSVKILVEDGSQAPKTNLGKRAALEQLNNLGLMDPTDIDQKIRVYRAFGQTEMMPALDAQVQGALAEQAAFETWARSPQSQPIAAPVPPRSAGAAPGASVPQGPPQPPGAPATMGGTGAGAAPMPPQPATPCPLAVKEWQRDAVHINEHEKWANGDVSRELFKARPDLELAFTLHLLQHKGRQAQAQAQQAMPAQPGAPPQRPGVGVARAVANSNQNSGKRGANQAPPG